MAKKPLSPPEEASFEVKMEQKIKELRPFFLPAGGIIILILLAIIVWSVVDRSKRKHIAAGYALLSEAVDKADNPFSVPDKKDLAKKRAHCHEIYQRVIKEFPGTPAAEEALFRLAELKYESGDYAKASKAFVEFQQQYSTSEPLLAMARLGEGNSLMAMGKTKEAYASFLATAKTYAISSGEAYIAPEAHYRAAVCGAFMGDTDEAKQQLDAVLAAEAVEDSLREAATEMQKKLNLLPKDTLKSAFEAYLKDQKEETSSVEQKKAAVAASVKSGKSVAVSKSNSSIKKKAAAVTSKVVTTVKKVKKTAAKATASPVPAK